MNNPGNAYAVFIGANTYADTRHLPALKYAEKDCIDLQTVLTDSNLGGFRKDNTTILLNEQVTINNIEETLYKVVVRDRSENDTVLVYYSGHGFIAGDQGYAYLATHDVQIDKLQNNPAAGLRMDRVHDDYFLRSRAKNVVFVLDCCHSGALTPVSIRALNSAPHSPDKHCLVDQHFYSHTQGRVAIVACPPDAVSRESDSLKNGIFTHYILKALRGDAADPKTGEVTLDNLMAYVRNHTPAEQPPGTYGQWYGRIVLSKPGPKRPARADQIDASRRFQRVTTTKPLQNPLDLYFTFANQLIEELCSLDSSATDLEIEILNAIARAINAQQVFVLRHHERKWVVKAQSQNPNANRGRTESALNRIVAALDNRISEAGVQLHKLSHDVSYCYGEGNHAREFFAVPLGLGSISDFMVVDGIAGQSLWLADPCSHILRTLYMATKELTSINIEEIESLIVDALKERYGYVPIQIYERRYSLFQRHLKTMQMGFQPILYLEPHKLYIASWEALARDPQTQRAPINLFRTAELWGLQFTTELDMFFLENALRSYKLALDQAGIRASHMQDISINVYPTSILRKAYYDKLGEAIRANDIPAHKLTLEISEKTPIPSEVESIEDFRQRLEGYVKQYHVGFAIDDFGVGYASVAQLLRLNPSYVKIDREALVQERGDSTIRFALEVVRAGRLNPAKIIVEGFDTDSRITLPQLYDLGVRYVQGYAIGKPTHEVYELSEDTIQSIERQLQNAHTPSERRAEAATDA